MLILAQPRGEVIPKTLVFKDSAKHFGTDLFCQFSNNLPQMFIVPETILAKKKDGNVHSFHTHPQGDEHVLVKWKGLLASENSWVPLKPATSDVFAEIEQTQEFRLSRGLVIEEVLGQHDSHLLVRWSDGHHTYVTFPFAAREAPLCVFQAFCRGRAVNETL